MKTSITVVGRCEKKHWSQSLRKCEGFLLCFYCFFPDKFVSRFHYFCNFQTAASNTTVGSSASSQPRLRRRTMITVGARASRERERARARERELELSTVVGFVCCEEVGFWPKRRGQSVDGKKWRSFCGHHYPLFFFGLFFRGGQNSSLQPHPSFWSPPDSIT